MNPSSPALFSVDDYDFVRLEKLAKRVAHALEFGGTPEERLGELEYALEEREILGGHYGLNADWSVRAWPIGNGLWFTDNEDDTFAVWHRVVDADGEYIDTPVEGRLELEDGSLQAWLANIAKQAGGTRKNPAGRRVSTDFVIGDQHGPTGDWRGRRKNPSPEVALVVQGEHPGVVFNVRVLRKGERYGYGHGLVWGDAEPAIEFYDRRYTGSEHGPLGQFVTRYLASSLVGHKGGLSLEGGIPEWTVPAKGMVQVENLARTVSRAGGHVRGMRARKNPTHDVDDLVRRFPTDAAARAALVEWREQEQDPEARLSDHIEWLMFSALDGGAVENPDTWARAASAAAFGQVAPDAMQTLSKALTVLWKEGRKSARAAWEGRARKNPAPAPGTAEPSMARVAAVARAAGVSPSQARDFLAGFAYEWKEHGGGMNDSQIAQLVLDHLAQNARYYRGRK